MKLARDDESDTDVRVSELILGLTDMSLLVCLGFIKVNADLVVSWSERGIVVSTLEDMDFFRGFVTILVSCGFCTWSCSCWYMTYRLHLVLLMLVHDLSFALGLAHAGT